MFIFALMADEAAVCYMLLYALVLYCWTWARLTSTVYTSLVYWRSTCVTRCEETIIDGFFLTLGNRANGESEFIGSGVHKGWYYLPFLCCDGLSAVGYRAGLWGVRWVILSVFVTPLTHERLYYGVYLSLLPMKNVAELLIGSNVPDWAVHQVSNWGPL